MTNAMGLLAQPDISTIDADGVVIARSVDPDQWMGKSVSGIEFISALLTKPAGPMRGIGLDGRDKIFGFAGIPGTPWHAIVGNPTDQLIGSSRRRRGRRKARVAVFRG